MKTLFKKIERLRKSYKNEYDFYYKFRHEIALKLCTFYPNIPIEIMEFYFVKHSNQGLDTLKGLPDIKASELKVSIQQISNKDLINKKIIENAPFTSYGEPQKYEKSTYDTLYIWYKDIYFKNGTWDYPIITIKENDKLWVVDGTNRFRHILICLKNEFDFIAKQHSVYVLNS